ncbi:LAGLIDADG family homing endonuclease [Nocardia tengchongensis]|uniref:LAGLIDADG family homing endonuclease n=1 Tax=Nocardia tengchongensis TaxID=2055889 RepID=UPI0036B79F80
MQRNQAHDEAMGKCTNDFESSKLGGLTASSRIARADNGTYVSLATLMHSGERPLVWSLDERMRFKAQQISEVSTCGPTEIVRLGLASGRSIDAAAPARMLTIDGWKRLDELTTDARIAIPRWIPHTLHVTEMPHSEVVLLAHMIGDGSFVKRQPIRYASIDEENLAAVADAAKHFGITAVRDDYAAARVTSLRLPAPYRLARGRRNPIAAWLDELGLFGLRSYEKFVPERIFALPTAQIAIFLHHLWATDGSIRWDRTARQARIYYASTSPRLINDVAGLLVRLGVHGRIKRVPKAGYRDCWHLTIDGADNQITFLQDISSHGARGVAGETCLAELDTMTSNPNVDTIPKEIWNTVRALLPLRNMTHREFQAAMGTKFSGSAMWKRSPSRVRLARAADILDAPELAMLCTNDVFWDRITQVTDLGKQETFAVTVAGTENLVAQGVSVYAGR